MSSVRKITESERTSLNKKLQGFHEQIYSLKDSNNEEISGTFHALPPRSLTDYYKMIKKPMSLQKIKVLLSQRKYMHPQNFINDLAQIVWNAMFYNVKGSVIYEQAEVLQKFINEVIEKCKKDTKMFGHDQIIYPYLGEIPDDAEQHEEATKVEQVPQAAAHTQPSTTVVVEEDEEDFETSRRETPGLNDDDFDYDDEPVHSQANTSIDISNNQQVIQGYSDRENQILLNAWIKRGRPPIIDRPHEQRIKNIMRNLKKVKSYDTHEIITGFFEKLPNAQLNPQYYEIITNPISFRDIKDKIKQRAYDNVQPFLNDMYLLISNAKIINSSNQRLLGYALLLEKSFQKYVNEEMNKPDSDFFQNDSSHQLRIPLDVIEVKGNYYKVGNWVLIKNPNDETKPIIGQIFRIWSVPDENNQRYINVCWYYRSEWTTHRSDRLFLENEVFKTGQYRDHIAEDIIGPCYVAYFTRWLKGDPDFKIPGPIFICEYRFNDHDKNFNKIRTWKACLPDEVRHIEDPIRVLNEPRLLKKYLSPIRHLLPPNAKDSDILPEPIIGNLNAPPLVGAVYYKTPSVEDDPNQYYCSLNPENTNLGAPLPETNPVTENGVPIPVKTYTATVSGNVRVPLGSSTASGQAYSNAPYNGSNNPNLNMVNTANTPLTTNSPGIQTGSVTPVNLPQQIDNNNNITTTANTTNTNTNTSLASVSINNNAVNNTVNNNGVHVPPVQSALPANNNSTVATNYTAYPSHYSNSNYQATKSVGTVNSTSMSPPPNSQISRTINLQGVYANQANQRLQQQQQQQQQNTQFHRTIQSPYNSISYQYSPIHQPTFSSSFLLDAAHDSQLDTFAKDGLVKVEASNYQRFYKNMSVNSILNAQGSLVRPDEVEDESLIFFRGAPQVIPNRLVVPDIVKSEWNRIHIKKRLAESEDDGEDEIISNPSTLGLKIPKLGHSLAYINWKLKQGQSKE